MVLHGLAVEARQIGPQAKASTEVGRGAGVVIAQPALEDAEPRGIQAVRGGLQHLVPQGLRVRRGVVAQQAKEGLSVWERIRIYFHQHGIQAIGAGT